MHDFQILTNALMLHNVRVPLLVLTAAFVLMFAAGIVLAVIALRREKKRALRAREADAVPSEEKPCS